MVIVQCNSFGNIGLEDFGLFINPFLKIDCGLGKLVLLIVLEPLFCAGVLNHNKTYLFITTEKVNPFQDFTCIINSNQSFSQQYVENVLYLLVFGWKEGKLWQYHKWVIWYSNWIIYTKKPTNKWSLSPPPHFPHFLFASLANWQGQFKKQEDNDG